MVGPLASVPNFRDVAALLPQLRPGRLYRSDLVTDLHAEDAEAIAACGIRCVVDLRGERERAHRPNHWFEEAGVEVVNFDVAGRGDPAALASALRSGDGVEGAHRLMRAVFRQFPAGAVPVIDDITRRMAGGELPLMVHCAAGKDRTGFVIAALLLALGVEPHLVEGDFLASKGRVHQRTRDHSRKAMRAVVGEEMDEEALAAVSGVHVSFLHSALEEVDRAFGSFDAYLAAAGATDQRLQGMRAHMLR